MRKNHILFSMMALAGVLFAGCSDDPENPTPAPKPEPEPAVVTLATEAVEASFEGEELSIAYTIENPVEGAELGFNTAADWVTNLSATESEIRFTVEPNTLEEPRTATVTISYNEVSEAAEFTITQGAYEAPKAFEIEVESIESASCITEVKPLDPEMWYTMYLVPTTYFAEYGIDSAEGLFEDDKATYSRNAEFEGMAVGDYMIQYQAAFQGNTRAQWTNLIPGKKYCLYAYGIEFNADKTDYTLVTDVVYEIITPKVAELQDITFDVNLVVEGPMVTAEITPNGWDGHYVVDYQRTSDPSYLDEGQEIDEEYINNIRSYWIDFCALQQMYGLTMEDVLDQYALQGPSSRSHELISGSAYCAVIYAVDNEGGFSQVVSIPHITRFETDPVQMVDMNLDIQVENIGSRVADITVTPSLVGEQYLFLLMPTDYLVSTDENDIIAELLTDYKLYAYYFKDKMTSHVSTLFTNTAYSIFCFGYYGGMPTTKLFRYDFQTEAEQVGEISVTDIEICGPYDPVALAEAMPEKYGYYADLAGSYLISTEPITDQPCDDVFHMTWYLSDYEYYMEYMPEVILADLIAFYCDPIEVTYGDYDWKMITCAVAMDKKGNISEMASEVFVYEYGTEFRPIDELVAKLTAPQSRAKLTLAGRQMAGKQVVKQDLVYHKDRKIQAPRRR